MAGILKVDRIQSDSNLAFNIAGSNVAFMNATSLQIAGSNVSLAGTNVITNGKLVTAGMPVGAVLQVVQNTTTTTASTSSSASYVDTTLTASITPTSATSKILVLVMQNIQVTNQNAPYGTGMWQLLRDATAIFAPLGGDNGNVFAYDYGNSGINVYRPTPITWLDSPNTTSSTTYKTQVKLGTNGGASISANAGSAGSIILLEIAA